MADERQKMGEKSGSNTLLDYLPSLNIWYNIVLLYLLQILTFIGVMFFFWLISSKFFYGAILGQTIVSTLLSLHFIYIAKNCEKIRNKYRQKYSDLAFQRFWFNYQSYTIPIICAAYYFPIFLINYSFLPRVISVPSHFITNILFPYYIAIPLSISILVFGFFMRRSSGGYDRDYDDYLHMIYPEKSRLLTEGMYNYIRNPQYVSRGIIAVGFGVLANNLSAVIVGLIHFVSYVVIIPAEDGELTRRFGDSFKKYKREVPSLFPKYINWGKFVRFIFIRENK